MTNAEDNIEKDKKESEVSPPHQPANLKVIEIVAEHCKRQCQRKGKGQLKFHRQLQRQCPIQAQVKVKLNNQPENQNRKPTRSVSNVELGSDAQISGRQGHLNRSNYDSTKNQNQVDGDAVTNRAWFVDNTRIRSKTFNYYDDDDDDDDDGADNENTMNLRTMTRKVKELEIQMIALRIQNSHLVKTVAKLKAEINSAESNASSFENNGVKIDTKVNKMEEQSSSDLTASVNSSQNPIKVSTACRPQILEVSSKVVEIHYPSRYGQDFRVTIDFDCHKLSHGFLPPIEVIIKLKYVGEGGTHSFLLCSPIHDAALIKAKGNSKLPPQRIDYFLCMKFYRVNNESTSVCKWLQLTTKEGKYASNMCKDVTKTSTLNFAQELLNNHEGSLVSNRSSRGTTLEAKLVVKFYENENRRNGNSSSVIRSLSQEQRIADLFHCRGHLVCQVILKIGLNPAQGIYDSVPVNAIILQKHSPVFKLMYESTTLQPNFGLTHIVLPNVSKLSIDSFINWLYGLDKGKWLEDPVISLELMEFGQEYMICDLIQVCTENLLIIPDEKYDIQTIVKVGLFGEMFEIPGLEDRAFDWMGKKSGLSASCLKLCGGLGCGSNCSCHSSCNLLCGKGKLKI